MTKPTLVVNNYCDTRTDAINRLYREFIKCNGECIYESIYMHTRSATHKTLTYQAAKKHSYKGSIHSPPHIHARRHEEVIMLLEITCPLQKLTISSLVAVWPSFSRIHATTCSPSRSSGTPITCVHPIKKPIISL